MDIIFATQNSNKVKEIQSQLKGVVTIKSLLDLNYLIELEETHNTLEGNAFQKAKFVFEKFGQSCFADDTGLEVEILEGQPGVYSARYAGESKSFDDNMNKLLYNLEGKENRIAQFRTVIALIIDGQEYQFEGVCRGKITDVKKGEKGFGYDPIFQPDGFTRTFAEMNLEEKAKISHRGLAVSKLIEFLNSQLIQ